MRQGGLSVIICAVLLTLAGTSSAAANPRFDNYVALGDSYTSGPLIPWQGLDPPGCARSTNNYPSLLAEKLGVDEFTDVSCGGATTAELSKPQDVFGGTNDPQFDALSSKTDLVTLGIGGNDFELFATLVDKCVKLREQDPHGVPCQQAHGAELAKALPRIGERVSAALGTIHGKAPNAKVMLIGYPSIVPKQGTCDRLPVADGDYQWERSVEEGLNQVLLDATKQDGESSYVDTYTPTLGHDICAKQPWINGKDTNPFAAMAYHPFKEAMVAEAGTIASDLGVTDRTPADRPYPRQGPVASPEQVRAQLGH